MLKDGEIVSHSSSPILGVSLFFLRRGGRIICRIRGKQRHDDGLQVLRVYVCCGDVKTIIHVHRSGH